MSVGIYPPRTSDFDAEPVDVLPCDGYRLFTPGAGQAGRYSFQVRAARRGSGTQRYHFDVARAGPDDTSPGIFVRNYQKVRGALHGSGIDVVDLYRFDVVKKSNLDLRLQTNGKLDLILLNDKGRRLFCACGEEAGATVERQIGAGALLRGRACPGHGGGALHVHAHLAHHHQDHRRVQPLGGAPRSRGARGCARLTGHHRPGHAPRCSASTRSRAGSSSIRCG